MSERTDRKLAPAAVRPLRESLLSPVHRVEAHEFAGYFGLGQDARRPMQKCIKVAPSLAGNNKPT
jgi:hypothetical protein